MGVVGVSATADVAQKHTADAVADVAQKHTAADVMGKQVAGMHAANKEQAELPGKLAKARALKAKARVERMAKAGAAAAHALARDGAQTTSALGVHSQRSLAAGKSKSRVTQNSRLGEAFKLRGMLSSQASRLKVDARALRAALARTPQGRKLLGETARKLQVASNNYDNMFACGQAAAEVWEGSRAPCPTSNVCPTSLLSK